MRIFKLKFFADKGAKFVDLNLGLRFGFGLGWQFLKNYRIGAGMQIQPVTNQFTTEEDTTGRLANRMSTLLTLEYLTN